MTQDFITRYCAARRAVIARRYENLNPQQREAVAMADELSTAVYAKEVYLFRALNLQGFMVQLATGEHDAMTCPECSCVFRAGWMNGQCPYCEAEQAAARYVDGMREAARE